MKKRDKILHLRSSSLDEENNKHKAPASNQLSYGEIAINYLKDNETIFIKNSKDEIVSFDTIGSNKILEDLNHHIKDYSNPHKLYKTGINGLSNLDNTSDYSKPISNSLQKALNGKMGKDELYDVNNTEDILNLEKRPTSAFSGKIMKESIDVFDGNWNDNREKIIKRIENLEQLLINY